MNILYQTKNDLNLMFQKYCVVILIFWNILYNFHCSSINRRKSECLIEKRGGDITDLDYCGTIQYLIFSFNLANPPLRHILSHFWISTDILDLIQGVFFRKF